MEGAGQAGQHQPGFASHDIHRGQRTARPSARRARRCECAAVPLGILCLHSLFSLNTAMFCEFHRAHTTHCASRVRSAAPPYSKQTISRAESRGRGCIREGHRDCTNHRNSAGELPSGCWFRLLLFAAHHCLVLCKAPKSAQRPTHLVLLREEGHHTEGPLYPRCHAVVHVHLHPAVHLWHKQHVVRCPRRETRSRFDWYLPMHLSKRGSHFGEHGG
eukprot:COSAG01_NODE_834_length_13230_cov_18.826746_18_plen_217_part_00